VGLLDIDDQEVSYAQIDDKNYAMATGLTPFRKISTARGVSRANLKAEASSQRGAK
jgi:hypothetical protein